MNISKKIAAIAVTAALTVAGLSVAQSASAAEIPGATITVTPTSGNVNTDTVFLNSIGVSAAAPVGFRALGGTVVFQNGNRIGSVSSTRSTAMPSTAGTNGLDGNTPVFMDRSLGTNNFVSNRLLNDPALGNLVPGGLVTGSFELRFYYFASSTAPQYTDPYVKLDMTYNATTGAWAVAAAPTVATPTTTSLTAQATGVAVSLVATVSPAAAAGTVSFVEGTTVVAANVPVVSGVATANLPTVSVGAHSYTAAFTPTVPADFAASTSGSASVTVADPNGIVATTNVTTTILAGAGGGVLTLTGVPATVALGTAALGAGTLNASGTLNAVVTDSRQLDYPSWSLTGQIADFKAGTKVLSGKYLGWTPAVTGAPNSVAGAVVLPAPGSVNGLKTISTLATGAPNDVEVSNVSALLQLKAPKNTPAGDYSAVLTLTLI